MRTQDSYSLPLDCLRLHCHGVPVSLCVVTFSIFFLPMTFQTSLVQIPQGSYLFVLVTITPFTVSFVLDRLMGPQPGWE